MAQAKKNLTQAQVAKALAKQLADAQRGDIDASALARTVVANSRLGEPLRSQVCTLGICIDFEARDDRLAKLLEKIAEQRPRHIEVFPLGIVVPDKWRVSVTYGLGE